MQSANIVDRLRSYLLLRGIMKIIKFIFQNIVKFIDNARDFSMGYAFMYALKGALNFNKNPNWLTHKVLQYKHKAIKKCICKKFNYIINRYKHGNQEGDVCLTDEDRKRLPIWILWYQGIENAPAIVRKCIASIQENSQNHEVIIITQNNYGKYLDLPEHIIRKVKEGKITLTHLSDIIRVSLLSKYGGAWMDATIYLSSPLDIKLFQYELYSNKRINDRNEFVGGNTWSSFFLIGNKENTLFSFMRDMFYEYWKNYDRLIDYYLVDYVISIAYDNILKVRNMIDKVPYNNPDIYALCTRLGEAFDLQKFIEITEKTCIHKMTWKKEFTEQTENKEMTYYHYLLNNFKIPQDNMPI